MGVAVASVSAYAGGRAGIGPSCIQRFGQPKHHDEHLQSQTRGQPSIHGPGEAPKHTLSSQQLSRLYKPWAADTHTHHIHT
jgi:hypothetical protein